jgi:transcriptional regulator with XRE-family HTH domain
MDALKVFAANLKKYRKERGLSQEAFPEQVGLHRTYISALEREKRNISIDNIQKIADALEIDTYKLFIDEPTKEILKSAEGSDCVNVKNSKHN